ncbi:MAG: hypothetical protein HY966_04015 [Ignavibacteriales bacterium]|nr:hypothetical protein [Ignavibacteriales bacterium]
MFGLLILSLVVLESAVYAQGIKLSITTRDSLHSVARLLAVRESVLVVESLSRAGTGTPTTNLTGVQLFPFRQVAYIECVDQSGRFESTTPFLASVLGGLLMAGISYANQLSNNGPSPGNITYALIGLIEGALLGGLLGWVIDIPPPRIVRITKFTDEEQEFLRARSCFPSGEPSRLRAVIRRQASVK